jgi:hypothetical protein
MINLISLVVILMIVLYPENSQPLAFWDSSPISNNLHTVYGGSTIVPNIP